MRAAAGLRSSRGRRSPDAVRRSARRARRPPDWARCVPSAAAAERERRAPSSARSSAVRLGGAVAPAATARASASSEAAHRPHRRRPPAVVGRARRAAPRSPWPRGNCDRPRRSGHRRRRRGRCRPSITSSPIALGRDLALAQALELAHDAVDHALDPLRVDRALAQRDRDRAHQLVAVERHAPAGALDHRQLAQLHPLEGGEARRRNRGRRGGGGSRVPSSVGRRVLHLGVVAAADRGSASPAPPCLRSLP